MESFQRDQRKVTMNSRIDELINELNSTENRAFEMNSVDFGDIEDLKKKVVTNAADRTADDDNDEDDLLEDFISPEAEAMRSISNIKLSKKEIVIIALILLVLYIVRMRILITLIAVGIIVVVMVIASNSKRKNNNKKK